MIASARQAAAGLLLLSLVAGLLCDTVHAQAKDIVIKGEKVCLRRLPDESGRIRLDCAIGLRGDDDQFYGLRSADPARAAGFPELNVRVRVTGKLTANKGSEFVEAGLIVYASIQPIPGEAKPVTGTFMCLQPRPAGARPVDKCRTVIKTDRGLHWGLDAQSLDPIPAARGLAKGDRISLEGDIVQDVPEEWHPWMFPSEAERIEGVLKVRSLKRLTE